MLTAETVKATLADAEQRLAWLAGAPINPALFPAAAQTIHDTQATVSLCRDWLARDGRRMGYL